MIAYAIVVKDDDVSEKGFERLVQFATGMNNIREVIPFPRTPHNASF